jgi:hypothetical protein
MSQWILMYSARYNDRRILDENAGVIFFEVKRKGGKEKEERSLPQ